LPGKIGAVPICSRVLAVWFGEPGSPAHGEPRKEWFRKDPAFDASIRAAFGELHEAACAGGLRDWEDDRDGAPALLIVLDQFSRNLHRASARAFAQDARALALAGDIVSRGWDRDRPPVERLFIYLPYEHAESLPAQDRAMELFAELEEFPQTRGQLEWVRKHREVIERFGRFPHRNAALGRASTPEEAAYLALPGSGF
jgi:uncharacterized protein (DUF924 family)